MTKNTVYLTQCDSTVGFVCEDEQKLNKIKNRNKGTKNILTIKSFGVLKKLQDTQKTANTNTAKAPRILNKYKNLIRRAVKTSFIVNDFSFRIINKYDNHFNFIDKFDYMYSSSANLHKQNFSFDIAYKLCDVCVFSNLPMRQQKPSRIIKLFVNNKTAIR